MNTYWPKVFNIRASETKTTDSIWLKACIDSLCSRYSIDSSDGKLIGMIYGMQIIEECNHSICIGVIEVLNRVIGMGFRGRVLRLQ